MDDDIYKLRILYDYYNLIGVYYDYLFDNIKNFYLSFLNKLFYDYILVIRDYDFKPKFRDILFDIKSYITKFYRDRYVNIFYVKNNVQSIRRIKQTLVSIKTNLISIPSSDSDYIRQMKYKLEDILKDEGKSYDISKIQDLAPVKSAPTNLANLRENLRDIRNDFVYFKKNIYEIKSDLDYLSNFKFFKRYAISEYSSSEGYDSLIKSFDLDKSKYNDELKKLHPHILDTFKNMNYLIDEINLIIELIPNVRHKLKNAKSKLDKTQLVKNILKQIELIQKIIISLDRSKFLFKNLKFKEKINKSIVSIKSIKSTLKWIEFIIERLKYINLEIVNIKSLKVNVSLIKEQIEKIKYNIKNINIILTNMKKLNKTVNELEFMISFLNLIKSDSKDLYIKPFEKYIDHTSDQIEILKTYFMLFQKKYSELLNLKCQIESRLKALESSVSELECAIEGVGRNFIRYSLEPFPRHLIKNNIKILIVY